MKSKAFLSRPRLNYREGAAAGIASRSRRELMLGAAALAYGAAHGRAAWAIDKPSRRNQMTDTGRYVDAEGSLHVPARVIPVPRSLSPQAQQALRVPMPPGSTPAPDDAAGWKAHVAQ